MALSVRGRKALAKVGLEDKLLEHGIPMRGRMLHDLNGRTTAVPYDPNTNQVQNNIQYQLFFVSNSFIVVGNSIYFGVFLVYLFRW